MDEKAGLDSFQELRSRVVAFRDARDWKQFHNPKDMALSLVLEATEVLEHFQWKNGEEVSAHVSANTKELSHELADVLYWILLMAHDLNIDLPEAFIEKLKRNEEKYPVSKSKGVSTKYTNL